MSTPKPEANDEAELRHWIKKAHDLTMTHAEKFPNTFAALMIDWMQTLPESIHPMPKPGKLFGKFTVNQLRHEISKRGYFDGSTVDGFHDTVTGVRCFTLRQDGHIRATWKTNHLNGSGENLRAYDLEFTKPTSESFPKDQTP